MYLSKLKKASTIDVEKWLETELNLTPYQKEKMQNDELIRFAPFEFYEDRQKENISFLWRLTICFIPFYFLALYAFLPIKMIITGKWGYGQKFIDGFHNIWMNKLKI